MPRAPFHASPFRHAAILVVDGIGEIATAWLGRGTPDGLEELEQVAYPHSIGMLWERVAVYLGFTEFDACKVMGLAAFGNPLVSPPSTIVSSVWWIISADRAAGCVTVSDRSESARGYAPAMCGAWSRSSGQGAPAMSRPSFRGSRTSPPVSNDAPRKRSWLSHDAWRRRQESAISCTPAGSPLIAWPMLG